MAQRVDLSPDGSLTIPPLILGKLRWRAGHRLLLEETAGGVLVAEIEAPEDREV